MRLRGAEDDEALQDEALTAMEVPTALVHTIREQVAKYQAEANGDRQSLVARLTTQPAFFKADRAGNMESRSDLLECRIQIGNLIVDVLDPHRNSNHVARDTHEAADIFRH